MTAHTRCADPSFLKQLEPHMSKAPAKKGDAVDLLDADHVAVKKLFQQFSKLAESDAPAEPAQENGRPDLPGADTCTRRWRRAVLSPRCAKPPASDDLMDEADVEHASAKDLIAQIERHAGG
jgi:hypothetical protein